MARADISLNVLAEEIRTLYKADKTGAFDNIENKLDERFSGISSDERQELLQQLIASIFEKKARVDNSYGITPDELNRILTILLGKEVLLKNLSPQEMMEQLTVALTTVFDSVNMLVGGINETLLGRGGEETIRMAICSGMDTEEGIGALKQFMDQIGDFFAIALKAYKEAANIKIGEILDELDPDKLEQEFEGKVKFGPMYKSHLYDCYLEKYATLRNWQRSGLLLEAFMKEFEKNCQHLYANSESK